MRVEKEDEKDADWDEELTHWYSSENNIHEDNFQSQGGGISGISFLNFCDVFCGILELFRTPRNHQSIYFLWHP